MPANSNKKDSEVNTEVPKVSFTDSADLEILEDAPEDVEDYPEDYPDYHTSVGETLAQSNAISIQRKREDVRGRLAILYTVATFTMFGLGFLMAVIDAAWRNVSIIENLTVILPLISGIFLGSLGFVLGYYFRKVEGEDRRD